MQSLLANQVCLFRQDHTAVAEDTQTCPWQQMGGKEQKETGRNGWELVKAAKGAGFPIHFSFAGPKPSPLITSSSSDVGPQPGRTYLTPQTLLKS